ncbi:MAG: tRNA adenosine(34) deaminase TadA [Gammaproteobacteria bacterium]
MIESWIFMQNDLINMQLALIEATLGAERGEVPVGAVIVYNDEVIARAHNAPIALSDPCAHAEVLALREAGRALHNYRLNDTTLYVTLEPCPMCVYAMIHARVARCVFAASDPKTGAMGGVIDLTKAHAWNHTIDVQGGVMAEESAAMLKSFFKSRR